MGPQPLSLERSPFGHAGDFTAGDDQAVEYSDVDQRQRLAQALRDEFVRLARLRDAARVVVSPRPAQTGPILPVRERLLPWRERTASGRSSPYNVRFRHAVLISTNFTNTTW